MSQVKINPWGNSQGIRLPKAVLEAINAETYDELELIIENQSIILRKKQEKKLTFEELFKDYDGESFQTDLQEFTPTGNEKW